MLILKRRDQTLFGCKGNDSVHSMEYSLDWLLIFLKVIKKFLVYCNAIKFGLCSPTFRLCCLLQGGMSKVEFVICRRMQIMKTVSACQDVCARDHKNEKSRLIPRGASVLNLKKLVSSPRAV